MTSIARGWLGALAVAALGCGPVRYAGEIGRASDAVEAARAVHADRLAPYWWTRATEYLHEARAVAGHADYQAANHYGRLATEAAQRAAHDATVAARQAPGPGSGAR